MEKETNRVQNAAGGKLDKIVLLGPSGSGKNSYMTLALCYLGERNSGYSILPGCGSPLYQQAGKMERDGKWPDKSEFNVSGDYEMKCESFIRRIFLPPRKRNIRVIKVDFPCEVGGIEDVQDQIQDSVSFLLTVDAERILDDDYEGLWDSFSCLSQILKNSSDDVRPNLAVVFTKYDAVESLWGCDTLREGRDRLVHLLLDKQKTGAMPVLERMNYEFFIVSCVPVPEHRMVSCEDGVVPNRQWRLQDMKDQLRPLTWLIDNLPDGK